MIYHIWEFYVLPENERDFERLNGPEGDWAGFFYGSNDFFGSNYLKSLELVLKDGEQARRYFTYDRWESEESFQRYIGKHPEEYDRLSERNLELVLEKVRLGFFKGGTLVF